MTRCRERLPRLVIAMCGGFVVLITLYYFLMLNGMRRTISGTADYVSTVKSARTHLPLAVEFERLFPGRTDHFITHYGFNRNGNPKTNTWNSEAYFSGRYSLTMQIEVIVNYTSNTIARSGAPTFYLIEYDQIDYVGPGVYSSSSRGIATFGESEWRKLVESNGDFSAIGVKVSNNTPESNFDAMVQAERRSLIRISLVEQ